MVTRVLDTSVAVKWFFQEDGTDRAEALLAELLGGGARVEVPSSLFYELANVLWTRRRDLTERQARTVWAELMAFPLAVRDWSDLLPEALTFAFRHDVTAYDGVFVVLARQLDCELVTADQALHRKTAVDCPWVRLL